MVQLTRIQHAPMSKYLANTEPRKNCILVGRNLRAGPALCGQPSGSISGDRETVKDRQRARDQQIEIRWVRERERDKKTGRKKETERQ